jgi:hypothetical protein
MALSHLFWTRVFKREFSPQLSAIVEALEKRMLPAFGGIEEEAEAVSQEAWEAFMSAPATGDEDPADFAEAAEQAGVSHYLLLDGIRQGMLNLFAAALYHAFEQQVMLFHRKQVLHPGEENDPNFFKMNEFQKRLRAYGIDITTFSSWPRVDELRLVANTVKHAEGDSAQKLHSLRPDLFEHPQSQKFLALATRGAPRVFQPLVGEDLYVSLKDIHDYRNALLEFWKELSVAMRRT